MKILLELKKGEKAVIRKVEASEPIKSRLFSLGFVKNAKIEIKDYTIGRQTIDCIIENTDVALRSEEAKMIRVEVV